MSPGCRLQPLLVWCASICANVQHANRRFVFVIRTGWSLESRIRSKISIEQFLKMGYVAIHVGEGPGPNFDELFLRRLKYRRRAEIVAHSFDVVPHLVVGTNKIATVATRLARKYARFLPLK